MMPARVNGKRTAQALMQGSRSVLTCAAVGSVVQVCNCFTVSVVCACSIYMLILHILRYVHLQVITGNRREMGVEELVCLGGFRNVRSDFDWAGCKLELDETQFEWGTVYEIEVESVRARHYMPAVVLWHA